MIDFGDLADSALINDVAIAAAYQLPHTEDPLNAASDLVAGYHSVTPLQDSEIGILFDLIPTRLVTTIVISGWRATLYPENSDYILRSNANSRRMLKKLAAIPRAEAQRRLADACR